MILDRQHDGSYSVIEYDWGESEDLHRGYLRFDGPEEYWHFYPTSERALTAGACRRIHDELVRLNGELPNGPAEEK